ncbi:hypothetical protein [Mycolicibacterium sp.]|uniref:hypothetical protein n=1 Tax=Mycolicibacterium sp. TaxID=2320850 RepID=UPI00355CAD39
MIANNELLELVRALPIPVPWDRAKFIDDLAKLRGRPIHLVAADTASLSDSPCGLWLKREHDDVILHEAGTSEYHIDQIVCHEIGHMVLGHDTSDRRTAAETAHYVDICQTIMPGIDPAAVRAVLGRANYISDQERDAEMFASLLMIAAADAESRASMMRSVFFHRL